MKAYKGFNKDMTCRGYQYEEGKTYELPEGEEAKLCEKGFHACENPVMCLSHYDASKSVYHEVELEDVSPETQDDTKRVARKISIKARLDVAKICKLSFDYVKEHCTNENNVEIGKAVSAGYKGAASAGSYGAASAGYKGAASAGSYGAASAGESGAASAGYKGAASAGSYGAASAGSYGAASAGYKGAASAGESGAASAGYKGAASAGESGAAVSRGSASSEKNGLSVARGNDVKVKGGLGALLVIAEEFSDSFNIKDWKAVIVDGETVKADTWYCLKDGELTECE